jgi:O-acetyl-ADP-ribose deacetylase (regulator of RNase III)
MQKKINNTKIELLIKDITDIKVDAVVNAANSRLAHGGGVAGAMVRKGGRIIQKESNEWIKNKGEVAVGHVAITTAGSLPAKYVIHAVGPRMGEGNEKEKLKRATLNSLKLADEYKIESIAFPAISTGIFGYPVPKCADIMLTTIKSYVKHQTSIKKVIFCLFGKNTYTIFKTKLTQLT